MSYGEKKQYAAKFDHPKSKSISVTVWDNGPTKGMTIVLRKRYKQGSEWRNTDTYFPNELEGVVDILKQAAEFCGPVEDRQEQVSSTRVVDY